MVSRIHGAAPIRRATRQNSRAVVAGARLAARHGIDRQRVDRGARGIGGDEVGRCARGISRRAGDLHGNGAIPSFAVAVGGAGSGGLRARARYVPRTKGADGAPFGVSGAAARAGIRRAGIVQIWQRVGVRIEGHLARDRERNESSYRRTIGFGKIDFGQAAFGNVFADGRTSPLRWQGRGGTRP